MAVANILQAFQENVKKFGRKPCLLSKAEGEWKRLSWQDAQQGIFEIARGLADLGIKKGEAVAILSTTRVEWTLTDMAVLSLGAITVPIYHSNTSDQAFFILQNSDIRVVFVENQIQLEKVLSRQKELPLLRAIVLIAGKPNGSSVIPLDQLRKKGRLDLATWEKGLNLLQPSDTATYVYTSGTTGPPKGAILTHGNIMATMEASTRLLKITPQETSILFLPLAHILGRVMEFYQLTCGFVHAYAESVDKLVDNIGEVRPHFFVSVPRIFEKVYERITSQVEASSPAKKAIFSWAVAVGREVSSRIQKGRRLSPWLALQREIASVLVFGKLKKRLGGRLRYAVSGGAPLAKEIAEFFHAAGILILEGYGLTETTAVSNCNTLNQFKFGTVGPPTYRVEEKFAEDGEILIRGPAVFQGYYKNPEATREALTPEGWFKTGDIGEIDADGFLRITDRKKDLIVTAGGKKVAPQNLENLLKTVPFISQAMVYGDKKKYISALVTLNRDQIESIAKQERIVFHDYKDLVQSPQVYALVKRAIDEKNGQLASFESIKKFAILADDFTQETGELTPTLKVKRKFVSEKYRDVLDRFYQETS